MERGGLSACQTRRIVDKAFSFGRAFCRRGFRGRLHGSNWRRSPFFAHMNLNLADDPTQRIHCFECVGFGVYTCISVGHCRVSMNNLCCAEVAFETPGGPGLFVGAVGSHCTWTRQEKNQRLAKARGTTKQVFKMVKWKHTGGWRAKIHCTRMYALLLLVDPFCQVFVYSMTIFVSQRIAKVSVCSRRGPAHDAGDGAGLGWVSEGRVVATSGPPSHRTWGWIRFNRRKRFSIFP